MKRITTKKGKYRKVQGDFKLVGVAQIFFESAKVESIINTAKRNDVQFHIIQLH